MVCRVRGASIPLQDRVEGEFGNLVELIAEVKDLFVRQLHSVAQQFPAPFQGEHGWPLREGSHPLRVTSARVPPDASRAGCLLAPRGGVLPHPARTWMQSRHLLRRLPLDRYDLTVSLDDGQLLIVAFLQE